MEKIAVIGLSCLFPGAQGPEAFWRNLVEGRDSRSEVTDEKMGMPVRHFYDPRKGVPDRFYCVRGGYILDFCMDPSGFHVPESFVLRLDDVFQWSLHVAREALRDAGCLGRQEILARCGVILGNLSMPTKSSNHLLVPIYHEVVESCLRTLLGREDFRLAPFAPFREVDGLNRRTAGYPAAVVAKALSLSGPCFALDAACASSLYSVRLACDLLQAREADLMLAGAVSAADPLFVHMGFSIFQAYPEETERSAPLDRNSAGLVAGEGAGMLVLKRWSDAVRDGDRIHAAVLGGGLSNDGRGQSVLSPNPKGQRFAFERAYDQSGVDPRSVDFVECHATGTPLGDKVELNSMDAFFGAFGASPRVGAVKSNLGHLLTAAGMAGLIKVILGMERGRIPPTIDLRDPQSSKTRVITAERIPNQTVPWPEGRTGRRAAVSAFGLGGTNAHLILEREGLEALPAERARGNALASTRPQGAGGSFRMAIVGMDAFFGACEGLSSFHRTSCDGIRLFTALPVDRWKGIDSSPGLLERFGFEGGRAPEGAYIESFEIDFMQFKIPPMEDDRLIPQHLLALKVADGALRQTGIRQGKNVAVVIAMETDLALHQMKARINLSSQFEQTFPHGDFLLSPEVRGELLAAAQNSIHAVGKINRMTSYVGNIMASRVSSLWDFSGPAFTVSSEENSLFKALQVARLLLEKSEVDAVLVGAVDLAGGPEHVLWRNRECRVNRGSHTMSFDEGVDGWSVGEGAGAVVLKRLDRAERDGDRIFATIDGIGFARGVSGASVAEACRRAFADGGLGPSSIGYLEVSGSGVPEEDEAEIHGLIEAYRDGGRTLACALGSVKANIGHTFAASGMASLIKTALCLYHRYLPGTPGWSGPKFASAWQESPFYVPLESTTWFLEEGREKRVAAVSGLGRDETCSHLILSEAAAREPRDGAYLASSPPFLVPVAVLGPEDLRRALDELKRLLRAGSPLAPVLADRYETWRRRNPAAGTLALVGRDREELLLEIETAGPGVQEAYRCAGPWASPRGSYFTPAPLGKAGKIAFVYPGGLNSYLGLGRDLFQLFPRVYDELCKRSSRLGSMVGERLLYPRSLFRLSPGEVKGHEDALLENPIALFESGIIFAIVFTKILRDCFGVVPRLALGYSMGEVSMMHALGVWGETDEMSEKLRRSPAFRTQLAGPMEIVRKAWGLPQATGKGEKIWHAYRLRASPEDLRQALEGEERAYLTFINTPQEVVISGERGACQRVMQRLGCEFFDVPMPDAIHCEVARPAYGELVKMHRLPVRPVAGIDFYSADRFGPLPIDADTVAENIAAIYCRTIDFPRLVRSAYEDGARVFVEVGPRENCTNWIGEILAGQAHLAVSVDRKGAGGKTSIVRALARLCSHDVDLDLSPLFALPRPEKKSSHSLVKSTSVGGGRIDAAILSEENRRRFQAIRPTVRRSALEASPSPERPLPEPAPYRPAAGLAPETGDPAGQDGGALAALRSAHLAFLEARREGLRQIGETIRLQMRLAAQGPASPSVTPEGTAAPRRPATRSPDAGQARSIPAGRQGRPGPPIPSATPTFEDLLRMYPPPPRRRPGGPKPPGVVWDYADLREFAEGRISNVFGERFAVVDTYRRCVRLPMEPYLLVTRVTRLNAETGVFRPCSITTEYDIPRNAWYSVDGEIPWAVAVESGQCDLLLISYLGIDFECKGERVYRLLDCTMTFLDEIPREGETLRYDIKIHSFVRTSGPTLFFFSYDCFVRDKRVLEMRGGCAGFFTDQELEGGRGIVLTEQEIEDKKKVEQKRFDPLLVCSRSAFERERLVELARRNPAGCFGTDYDPSGRNRSPVFTAEPMLMMDRVVSVDPRGGAWGLGLVVAQKDLEPNHWYFPCHFKDDEVLAGSLMAEGCGQLMRFYMLYLGLQTCARNARFQPLPGVPQKVRCRGQIVRKHKRFTYRMEVKEIGTDPRPYAIANVDILLGETVVVDFRDLGMVLVEEEPHR
jgi:PfaB family protein